MNTQKRTWLAFMFICLYSAGHAQAVGIGTTTPSSSAILDIASADKGLRLPRINDTTMVTNPTEGLFIYNLKTGSPNYYDGSRWQNFNTVVTLNPYDSITYTIATAGSIGYNTTPKDVISLSHSGNFSGSSPNMNTVYFAKLFDINSVPFKKAMATGYVNSTIEFKIYTRGSGSPNPYFSVKLTNWNVTGESFVSSSLDGKLAENYTLSGSVIGFKDWTNNISFGYNQATNTIVVY
jgi:type VI protein secretion system component Hcp